MMDTYWLEGIRESIEEKSEEDDKNTHESENKPSQKEDVKN